MTRIPDAVAFASLDTHRLIVAVRNDGSADVACNLPRAVAADSLRQLAARLEGPAGLCDAALATASPCPVHDAPAAPPAGLDDLLDHVAATVTPADDEAVEEPAALTADDVRDALAFNADRRDQVLATFRDVLLDTTATRTAEQALDAARILLAAHAQQLAALVEVEHNATRTRWGLNRSTRGLLTGYSIARRAIRTYAARLADE